MPAQAKAAAEQGKGFGGTHAETGLKLPAVIMGRILRKRDPWAMCAPHAHWLMIINNPAHCRIYCCTTLTSGISLEAPWLEVLIELLIRSL